MPDINDRLVRFEQLQNEVVTDSFVSTFNNVVLRTTSGGQYSFGFADGHYYPFISSDGRTRRETYVDTGEPARIRDLGTRSDEYFGSGEFEYGITVEFASGVYSGTPLYDFIIKRTEITAITPYTITINYRSGECGVLSWKNNWPARQNRNDADAVDSFTYGGHTVGDPISRSDYCLSGVVASLRVNDYLNDLATQDAKDAARIDGIATGRTRVQRQYVENLMDPTAELNEYAVDLATYTDRQGNEGLLALGRTLLNVRNHYYSQGFADGCGLS